MAAHTSRIRKPQTTSTAAPQPNTPLTSPVLQPAAATSPVTPPASGEAVTVACRLPQGLHLDIVKHGELRKRVTLSGANSAHEVAGFGITEHVPRAFFEQWLADHAELPAVKNGLIFAHRQKASVQARASERSELKSGLELEAYLRAATAKLEAAGTFEVGFMSRATEAAGMLVLEVAMVNEFGGTVTVPEHEVTVYRRINVQGEFSGGALDEEGNGVGAIRLVKRSKSNYATMHTVPAYTVKIPPRPFFRTMVTKESPHWGSDLGKVLVAVNYDAQRALDLMGETINGELQQSVRDFSDPPNAASTVEQRGFNDTLVDTGTMLKSTA